MYCISEYFHFFAIMPIYRTYTFVLWIAMRTTSVLDPWLKGSKRVDLNFRLNQVTSTNVKDIIYTFDIGTHILVIAKSK